MTPESLLDLFVLAPVGLVEIDGDGRVEVANLAARRLLAPFTASTALDNLFDALREFAPELASHARGFDPTRGIVVEGLELRAPHTGAGVQLSLVKTGAARFVAIVNDATALAAARAAANHRGAHLRAIEGAVRDHALYTVSPEGAVHTWSESAERVYGWAEGEIMGKPASVLSDDPASAAANTAQTLAMVARQGWTEAEGNRRRHDGTVFWASTVVTPLRADDGGVTAYSVVTRDLSERKKREDAERDDGSSPSDFLTGVATRRAFFEIAGLEVARGRRYGQPLSLLLVEPDRFRETLDRHGEAFTQEWLRVIAGVCRQESRNTDIVGRMGGEDFAVLLPSTELSGGLVLAERIRERMQRHLFGGEHTGVRCTVSIGVSELTETTHTVEELVGTSATAVDRARQAGRNLVVGYDA